MPKHITDKDLKTIVGDLDEIKYLDDKACENLVSILNVLIERIIKLEDSSPNNSTVVGKNNVFTNGGAKV